MINLIFHYFKFITILIDDQTIIKQLLLKDFFKNISIKFFNKLLIFF